MNDWNSGPRLGAPQQEPIQDIGLVVPGLHRIWNLTKGDSRVCIAVLDGPADVAHDCLRNARIETIPFRGPAACAASGPQSCSHGTHVASVLFAQSDSCLLQGVAPMCRGLIIPVFSDSASGIRGCSQRELASAISIAVARGAAIINISAGQLSPRGDAIPQLASAIHDCARRGVLVFAAAGNDGCDCVHVPGALPNVVVVGAHDKSGVPTTFSNYGSAYMAKGILALGDGVPGARVGGGVCENTGTSFATPIVSGVAALLLSIAVKERSDGIECTRNRSLSERVRKALLESATPCPDRRESTCRKFLTGRLNILGAIQLFLKGANVMPDILNPDAGVQPFHSDQEIGISMAPGGGNSIAPIQTQVCKCKGEASLEKPALEEEEEGKGVRGNHEDFDVRRRSEGMVAPRQKQRTEGRITPSHGGGKCSCGGDSTPQLVYALGEPGYDLGTEARHDSIDSQMAKDHHPSNPLQLLAFLAENPHYSPSVIWTLNQEATPVYAIVPVGAYDTLIYDRLREFNAEYVAGKIERISVPGVVSGSVRLFNGQNVPVIIPELRGMWSWSTEILAAAVTKGTDPRKREALANFLDRVYYELRNMGLSSQERAINFAATNAFSTELTFEHASANNLELESIDVEKSPICRPDSDCWDVKLIFFNPLKAIEEARTVYRFTVDVSDVVPVVVGKMRHWTLR